MSTHCHAREHWFRPQLACFCTPSRRAMCRKRNADRDAQYDAWLERQAPPPVTEADIQEEELAKMAHSRIRAWAKTLLDATALHADLLQRNPGGQASLTTAAALLTHLLNASSERYGGLVAADPGNSSPAVKDAHDGGAGSSTAADPLSSSRAPCWTQARPSEPWRMESRRWTQAAVIALCGAGSRPDERPQRPARRGDGARRCCEGGAALQPPKARPRARAGDAGQAVHGAPAAACSQRKVLSGGTATMARQGSGSRSLLGETRGWECRANNLLIAEMDKLRSRKHPDRDARNNLRAAAQQLTDHWRTLKRHAYLQQEVVAKEKGKSIARPGERLRVGSRRASTPRCAASAAMCAAGADDVEQDDIYTCPICTDLGEQRTVTACGHFFCSECLQQALSVSSTCPLCRRPLTGADLFDAFTPDEAADAAERSPHASGEFSTKASRERGASGAERLAATSSACTGR